MNRSDKSGISSRIYACRVTHERLSPKRHAFTYRLFYLALDLDELGELDRRLPGFSMNDPNLFSLWERDYLPPEAPSPPLEPEANLSLKQRVIVFCRRRGIDLGAGAKITLVTLPRVFGYAFNPVSFYFCRDEAGVPRCAIAEVTNTYREMKAYFLPRSGGVHDPVEFAARVPKHFYVSPFSSLETAFDFRLFLPGRRIAVRIDDFAGADRTLHSTLTGEAEALTGGRLAGCLFRYPLVTLRVILLIHWQALRLWWKGVPHFAKAARPDLQRDVRRPHASLAPRPLP